MDRQDQDQLFRLQRVEVDGLFGIYNHRIDLYLNDRVTLLHGQNGVGKTTVLRMINALLCGDVAYFSRIPFTRFLLIFHDDSRLELTPVDSNTGNDEATLTLTTESGEKQRGTVELRSGEAMLLAARTDHLEPFSSIENTWIDVRDGEVLTEIEVLSRYGEPGREYSRQRNPSWLDGFLQNVNTYLIEAQRLVRTPLDAASRDEFPLWYRHRAYRGPMLMSRVAECSQDFKNRLDFRMAEYGRQAQALDQTYPQRLMTVSTTASDKARIHNIQTRMTKLAEKTDNYKAIGILDETTGHTFDISTLSALDGTRVSALNLYVDDTERKLEVLDDLANRTRHLLDSINSKFRHKHLRLDQEKGLVAKGKGDQKLPLHSLSSGEQHELVMHYDLLFKTRPNTIVLIDEPEISLHVAWQKNFLSDLMEIVRISNFDTVIATHSPYIIGGRDDLMVGLGDSD